jgi:hypothetical protein
MNMMNVMNVSRTRRPRRLPGIRPAPNPVRTAAAGSHGISRGRFLDGPDKQMNRARPGLQDDKLTTVTSERRKP